MFVHKDKTLQQYQRDWNDMPEGAWYYMSLTLAPRLVAYCHHALLNVPYTNHPPDVQSQLIYQHACLLGNATEYIHRRDAESYSWMAASLREIICNDREMT